MSPLLCPSEEREVLSVEVSEMPSLRAWTPGLLLLGLALAGCSSREPAAATRPAKPVEATVLLEVPGMT